ncbi:MAG: hypothetical protein ACKOER_10950, partial [Betaproteobacteria bacterium]
RFAPAMALCESTDARITDIADRINRAAGAVGKGVGRTCRANLSCIGHPRGHSAPGPGVLN